MSHFTTIVFCNNPSDLEKKMAPYHEFECTGLNNEYVVDVDITSRVLQEYEENTTRCVVFPDGTIKSKYSDEFHTTGDFVLPDGCLLEDRPLKDVYKTDIEYVQHYRNYSIVEFGETPDLDDAHKYGYIALNEDGTLNRVIDRTNPNAKWDWYVVGGRWSGYFFSKNCDIKEDILLKKNLDKKRMYDEHINVYNSLFDKYESLLGEDIMPTFGEFKARYENIEEARTAYWSNPVIQRFKKSDDFKFHWNLEEFGVGREAYVQQMADSSTTPFAFIDLDGNWREKGNMGWFGISIDNKDQSEWSQGFWEYFDSVPEDTCMILVDCHI